MTQNRIQVILNPVRMRIVQHLLLHQTATTSEIAQALPDVPKASLYRHIKKLTECGILQIQSVQRIRGTVQRTYGLAPKSSGPGTGREIVDSIYTLLIMLAGDFEKYHQKKPEPQSMVQDMLLANQSTLMLSDQEFEEFLSQLEQLFQRALKNEYREGRKPRVLTLISSPYLPDSEKDKTEDNSL